VEPEEKTGGSRVGGLLTIITTILVIAYPILVYLGISRFDVRSLSLLLLAVLLPLQLIRLRGKKREHLKAVLPLPLGIVTLLLLSALVDDRRFLLALPVLINALLLTSFATTLRAGQTPIIERFARLQVEDLPDNEVAYCRSVTIVWVVFLALNTTVSLLLALFAPVSWWALYSGGIVYMLMGMLFTVEYLYRKYRFRRYGDGWHDRAFAKLFPPKR
jgi:uncharacterized membrane protein